MNWPVMNHDQETCETGFSPTLFVTCSLTAIFVAAFSIATGGEPVPGFKPTNQDKIFPAQAQWKVLWADGEFTEGPAVSPTGEVYFSDIGNRMMKYNPAKQETVAVRDPSGRSNGLFFHGGQLFVCEGANTEGQRRLTVTSAKGRTETLVDHYRGKKLNSPNDLFVAPSGNLFFTDPRYVGDEPVELDFHGVFRVTPQGTISIATKELTRPNGILINRDESRAWVAEHHPTKDKQLLSFKIDARGAFSEKKVLFDFGQQRGIDGMCFGPDGNIYATAGDHEHSGIYVFSRDGKHLAFQPTPGAPTNCTFGMNDQSKRLYLTAATSKSKKVDQATDENASEATPLKYGLFYLDLK